MNNLYPVYISFTLSLACFYMVICLVSELTKRELLSNFIAAFLFVPVALTSLDAIDYANSPRNHEQIRVLLADHYGVPLDTLELTDPYCNEGKFSCTMWSATFYFEGYAGIVEFNDTEYKVWDWVHYRRGLTGELLILIESTWHSLIILMYLLGLLAATPVLVLATFRKLKLLLLP